MFATDDGDGVVRIWDDAFSFVRTVRSYAAGFIDDYQGLVDTIHDYVHPGDEDDS